MNTVLTEETGIVDVWPTNTSTQDEPSTKDTDVTRMCHICKTACRYQKICSHTTYMIYDMKCSELIQCAFAS